MKKILLAFCIGTIFCSCENPLECHFDYTPISRYKGWVVAQKDGVGFMNCSYETACKEHVTDGTVTIQIWTTELDYNKYSTGEKIK